ncbi:hypothetical protein LVD17_10115 [Fulvivirga ulvae]|uniref:hypothetical protein n=1 Tax=Fulvivirga ulvae TaxID=2904245 RepID=UPI001F4105CC|nr:hypothetical protein [Fulvivirga ulvae]UII34165.1 hypothetical protein LVD17_10115 [Fulvivirga ulvae]
MLLLRFIKLSFFIFICSATAFSQNLTIEESEPLKEEPTDGWLKLFQFSNGNTALIHITEKDGMQLWVYDSSRKLKLNKPLNPQFHTKGNLSIKKGASIEAAFSIGSDLVLFIEMIYTRAPILYRVIINTDNGAIKEENEVARLDKYSAFAGYAMAYGNVPQPKFYIRKDEHSDNYAVALFNSFVSDRNKRIKLIHYGSDHQIINSAFYHSPNEEFKYLDLIDMVVLGDKKVIACANGFNTNKSDEGTVLFASLEKGDSYVNVKKLQFTENQYFTSGMLRYNKKENLVVMLALKQSGSAYTPKLIFFDADTYSTVFYKDVSTPNVDFEHSEIFGKDKKFNALPQIIYINDDGTYTMVFEEITIYTSSNGSSSTTLGSMVVSILDRQAKVLHNTLIPKSHFIVGYYPALYPANRNIEVVRLIHSNQYKSFSYACGQEGKYIFFNDIIENLENIKKGKLTRIAGIGETDAFVCEVNSRQRGLLYGQPEKKTHNFAAFRISDYNKESGYFTTLKLENSRDKKATITWIKLK